MNLGRLTTESRNPASENLDRLGPLEIVHLMNEEDARVVPAIRQVAGQIAQAMEAIAERLKRDGRLVYIGAGTSGRLGVLDAAECPPTFNTPPWQVVALIAGGPTALVRAIEGAEDDPRRAVEDLRRIGLASSDVLVGIATSGRTPYVLGGLEYARSVGAFAIGLSCNASPELAAISDLTITPVVGPEILSGSTRLKAGTATKLVLNMLTTGAMVRLGKTYGNLMVDLQATNEKLADRSRRIVSMLTDVPVEEAARLLDACQGDVKTAVVVGRRGVDPAQAAALLRRSGGQLRAALADEGSHLPPTPSPPARRMFLGVDGGGSKTLAWLVEEGEEEPRGRGGADAANPRSVGWAGALANVERAMDRAFREAGLPRQPVAAACLAIAGLGRLEDQNRMQRWAERRGIAERLVVGHDATALLAAAEAGGVGIALIAGTGSMAFGRARGETARAGGWGHPFGDEGSGYAVVRRALRAVARAVDGRGARTALGQEFCEALGANDPVAALHRVQERGGDRAWLAALAPCVIRAAESGDPVARGILDRAADDLAELVRAVQNRLGLDGYRLALGGGLLVGAEALRRRLRERLEGKGLEEAVVVEHPVRGAVQLARQAVSEVS